MDTEEDNTPATSVVKLKDLVTQLGWVVVKDEDNKQLLFGPTVEEATLTHTHTLRKMLVKAADDGFILPRTTVNWQWEQGSDHLQFAEALVKKYIEEQDSSSIIVAFTR